MDDLGLEGHSIQLPIPSCGPDELLVRHDACGLCFSDVKVIRLGPDHPRIYRDMRSEPVTLGHEVALTVVGVGQNLKGEYRVGDRFIIQADIFVNGVGYAYGYEIQGGLSQYGLIDRRVLDGDDGNYLIPVQPGTGYAEAALTEPWACVIAAYGLTYRTAVKPGGTAWIIGTADAHQPGDQYTISRGFGRDSHPSRLYLTAAPTAFAGWLARRASALDIDLIHLPDLSVLPDVPVDDIIFLGSEAHAIERVSPCLADHGVLALISASPLPRKVAVDVGRIHYNRWLYIGGTDPDISVAYDRVPIRSSLRSRGTAWFVGAAGPMGRMHVQRAIQSPDRPASLVCTDVSDARLADLSASFSDEARANGVHMLCLNPLHRQRYAAAMAPFKAKGFDDIIVLAPVPSVIEDAAGYLAPRGVMNVFAGVARGTMVDLDLGQTYLSDTRVIGHSASTIDDLRLMLSQAESGQLSPNRSVAAIGSLAAARNGLQAVEDAAFAGKIVIYPNIRDLPLTSLQELAESLPTVHARLRSGREWTVEAEQELLRIMLP
jgi:threonine dehydrogenase-like Zn-dependent dehydrogenase